MSNQDRIGGIGKTVKVTPASSTAAYSINDLVGGKLRFRQVGRKAANGLATGRIQDVKIIDDAKQSVGLELWLFSADMDTTFTDNVAWNPTDADLENLIGVVELTSYNTGASNSVTMKSNVGLLYDLGTGLDVYGAVKTLGTPVYSSTSANDLTVMVGFDID